MGWETAGPGGTAGAAVNRSARLGDQRL